mmetsp:Transcript_87118/g.154170  ORF Transcript_87118/g.154170 Transcript_87118/m.154170 type:complete len:1137 (+) Transcript_87118:209-3619(+)|eukprot:CAMPEP_0197703760 /NCGR_PEP_ID=MMETSP1338-20131121/125597_1 /TAXON_ID=43686 ORGANISM="Pelagodinium beii, Strain RCC1491" /NCGR_SAMPLE_ID=MMETSP1338 /ASSEMBLY_ACC=CAM_ASM_000754 /LENGTH=1136 /DNA_ID=CAMNT_0043287659 /DNA_START=140 /DNA_END=3550 /DNA_ORIENTATION=-
MALQGAAEEVQPGAVFGPAGDEFEIGKELGNGAASRVFACRRLSTGERLAVKAVDLRRLCLLGDLQEQLSRLDGEVGILHELCHERIVNLQAFHKSQNWYFLVMELVEGGELFDLIVRSKSLSEAEARHVFLQLLKGVGYMHERGVLHRDLKPENILVASSRPAEPPGSGLLHDVKIADFGLSKAIGGGASLARTRVGTPQYWAPEVLDVQRRGGSYDQAADFWGLGAILFVMLCGRYPFDGQKQALDDQIRTAAYSMTGARWRGISDAAKSLVRGLLRVNPVDRLSLDECLRHPWVTGEPMLSQAKKPIVSPALPSAGKKILEQQLQQQRSPEKKQQRRQQEQPEPEHQPQTQQHQIVVHPAEPDAGAQRLHAESTTATTPRQHAKHLAPPEGDTPEGERTQSTSCYSVSDDCDPAPRTLSRESRSKASASSNDDEGEEPERTDPQSPDFPRLCAFAGIFSTCIASLTPWLAGRKEVRVSTRTLAIAVMIVAVAMHSLLNSKSIVAVAGEGWMEGKVPHFSPPPQPVLVTQGSSGGGEPAWAPPPQDPFKTKYVDRSPGQPPQLEGDEVQRGKRPAASATSAFQFFGEPEAKADDSCAEKQTVFRLNELLKLQVSIVGSLEMANLAFRHADSELAEATRLAFQQARELFKSAASVVSRYAEVAGQVSHTVLPDLQLAVDEQEPALAASLLDVVRSWVADMKTDSDVIRQAYADLQALIVGLVERAKLTKQAADVRLAEAVRDAASAAATEPKKRQKGAKTAGSETEPAAEAPVVRDEKAVVSSTARSSGAAVGLDVCQSAAAKHSDKAAASSADASAGSGSDMGVANPAAMHLNSLTRQLFDQLSELGVPEGSDALVAVPGSGGNPSVGADVENWQRNVVDLLFLAPGIVPSVSPVPPVPPQGQNMSTALSVFQGSLPAGLSAAMGQYPLDHVHVFEEDAGSEEEEEAEEAEDEDVDGVDVPAVPGFFEHDRASSAHLNSSTSLAVYGYAAKDAKAEAQKAARSSAALVRALRELRRVDSILEGCFVFWANMDGTVQKLGQMKEHAERLVSFASSKPKLRERFEQRMQEYERFWVSLEQLCRQYSLDHQAISAKMRDFIREVSDAADLVDTAESARAGARAAGMTTGRAPTQNVP